MVQISDATVLREKLFARGYEETAYPAGHKLDRSSPDFIDGCKDLLTFIPGTIAFSGRPDLFGDYVTVFYQPDAPYVVVYRSQLQPNRQPGFESQIIDSLVLKTTKMIGIEEFCQDEVINAHCGTPKMSDPDSAMARTFRWLRGLSTEVGLRHYRY